MMMMMMMMRGWMLVCSSKCAAAVLRPGIVIIRIADSGAWPDAGGSLSVSSALLFSVPWAPKWSSADRIKGYLAAAGAAGNANPWADCAADSTQGPREREWGLDARRVSPPPALG